MPMPNFNSNFANACALNCPNIKKDESNNYICKQHGEDLIIREIENYHQDVVSRGKACIKKDGNTFGDMDTEGNKGIIKAVEKEKSRTNKVKSNREHYYWVFELHIPLRIRIPRFISKYIVEAYSQIEKKTKLQ